MKCCFKFKSYTILIILSFIFCLTKATSFGHASEIFAFNLYPKELVYGDGSPHKINFSILADGYTSNEMDKFVNDSKRIIKGIFKSKAYTSYENGFNFYAVKTPSAESSFGKGNNFHNTFFGSKIVSHYIDLTSFSYPSRFALSQVQDTDFVLIMLNSKEYGGRAAYTTPSVAVFTSDNSLSVYLALHEIGHSFANLADEYKENKNPREAANLTKSLSNPPWKQFLGKSGIGVFKIDPENDWVKPSETCCMNWIEDEFCKVCIEAHQNKIKTLLKNR